MRPWGRSYGRVGARALGPSTADLAFGLLWAVGTVCALGAAYQAKFHRLAALVLLGGAGLVTCLTFIWLSAPDLALTQLAVETVTTVLLLLGLRWLPKRLQERGPRGAARLRPLHRAVDLAIAVAAGAGLAVLAYAAMTRPAPDSISRYFVEHAYTQGGGTNVVNVILVDFRGFDTLGEITVLCVVALTVYALLRRFRPAPESFRVPSSSKPRTPMTTYTRTRRGDTMADALTVPALLMRCCSRSSARSPLFLFLRGHDLPGGGFVAGITMAIAVILQYMAGGTRWVEARLHIRPVRWMGVGLLLAAGTGAAAWLFGRPFSPPISRYCRGAGDRRGPAGERPSLRLRRFRARGRRDRADADRARAPVRPKPPCRVARAGARAAAKAHRGGGVMEVVLALGIGALAGSGVWLILRPRTFQVIIGLSLLSYAVNLFILVMGRAADRRASGAHREMPAIPRSTPIHCRRRSF